MNIIMNTEHIRSIDELERFLQGTGQIEFNLNSKKDKYHFILETLVTFKYLEVRKKYKSLIKKYLIKVTGYSEIQIKRLILKWKGGTLLSSLKNVNKNKFVYKYNPTDIALLAKADEVFGFPHAKLVSQSLKREYNIFSNAEYRNISQISVSHIYNIRKNNLQYISATMHYTKTNPTSTCIGERVKPKNDDKPGYIRVDSVHQGDYGGVKGVYHINLVDEVTQWQIVCCVPVISNKYLIPALQKAMEQFPFKIINFHSDNGSEYINKHVSEMLQREFIKQTKSRSRKTNDQALVEGKNGSVIRKHIGRSHIPKIYANPIELFYQKYFNIYLNYHRSCGFATDYVDKKGKIKKKYDEYLFPYEKLKSIKHSKKYLRNNITFEQLDRIAYAKSDIEIAEIMQEKKTQLFKSFKQV